MQQGETTELKQFIALILGKLYWRLESSFRSLSQPVGYMVAGIRSKSLTRDNYPRWKSARLVIPSLYATLRTASQIPI